MKTLPHRSRPILMWALLSAVIFFAVAWLLGKLFRIESLHRISEIAIYVSAALFVITNPVGMIRWPAKAIKWLCHAGLLLPLPERFHRMAAWSLFAVEALSAFIYLLGMWLGIRPLQSGATIAFSAGLLLVAIILFPLLFRSVCWLLYWCGKIICGSLFLVRTFYRWLNFRRIVLLSLGFCALILLFYAEEDWRGWRAWQNFKHEWEAKGERFDYASIVPPPVPDDQNFALTPIVATCYEWGLTKDGKRITPFKTGVASPLWMSIEGYSALVPWPTNREDWQRGRGTDLEEWQNYYRAVAAKTNEFPVTVTPQSPAADVLLALSKYDPAIEELRKASALPYSRFPLNYNADMPFNVLLMHLSTLKYCTKTLALRTVAELENGQCDKALDDVRLSLRLIDSTRTEPFLISHLVRADELQMLLQPVWEGLSRHRWSDAQLAAIEQELGKLDFLADSQLAMHGERNQELSLLDYFRKHRPYQEFRQVFAPSFVSVHTDEDLRRWNRQQTEAAIYFCLIPSGWFYQNKILVGKTYQQWFLNITDPAKQEAFPQIQEAGGKFVGSLPHKYWNSLARQMLPSAYASVRKMCHAQGAADLAQTACALERYRLAHGEYPETLDALMPQFIGEIPHDIIGGQPLHYRRTKDGKYSLYSVGWNGQDDGGKIGLVEGFSSIDPLRGDWVWPCD